MKDIIIRELKESANLKLVIADRLPDTIAAAAEKIIETYKNGGKLLLAGNGGSAADAQHIAAEMVGHFQKERPGLPAIALTVNTSIITALANDGSYDKVFNRQIETLAAAGDTLIVFTTSGNSPNIVEAAKTARARGLTTIGLLGNNGGKLKNIVDIAIIVPSDSTPRIQEAHITIGHVICRLVEEELTG
jgi:D-sedoheptulose 7-phosphate isomerase